MTEERLHQIQLKADAVRREASREELAPRIAEMVGYQVTPEDFLEPAETEQLAVPALEALKSFQVKHRIWGSELRGEMLACTSLIADELNSDHAFLLTYNTTAGGIRVPIGPVLRHFARVVGPKGPDALLVSEGATSGLNLGYNHPPNAYEYELQSWGRFAFDLSKLGAGLASGIVSNPHPK